MLILVCFIPSGALATMKLPRWMRHFFTDLKPFAEHHRLQMRYHQLIREILVPGWTSKKKIWQKYHKKETDGICRTLLRWCNGHASNSMVLRRAPEAKQQSNYTCVCKFRVPTSWWSDFYACTQEGKLGWLLHTFCHEVWHCPSHNACSSLIHGTRMTANSPLFQSKISIFQGRIHCEKKASTFFMTDEKCILCCEPRCM